MKVGLVYAMAEEIRSILTEYNLPEPVYRIGIPFYEISDNIVAVAGGIGKVNIAAATAMLCENYNVDIVLNSGLAGGFLDYPIGTKVLVDRCVQHDIDTSATGDPIGLVSGLNMVDFYTYGTDYIAGLLKWLNFDFKIGAAASGDWFAVKGTRAEQIADLFHPTVADMEAGAIAQICHKAGVKFISLKAISDILGSGIQHEQFYSSLNEVMSDLNYTVKRLVDVLIKEPVPEGE